MTDEEMVGKYGEGSERDGVRVWNAKSQNKSEWAAIVGQAFWHNIGCDAIDEDDD